MILEELVGVLVSLSTLLITQTPQLSRENLRRYYWVIFEQHTEDEEQEQGLVHREYEPNRTDDSPYYEEIDVSVSTEGRSSRSVCESLRRSFQVNFVLLLAVVLLGLVTVVLVYVDLNTTNSCIEWKHYNHSTPSTIRVLQIIGTSLSALPLYLWFPACAAMLWGLKEFKEHHLSCLFTSCFTVTLTIVYRAVLFDQYSVTSNYKYRYESFVQYQFVLSRSVMIAHCGVPEKKNTGSIKKTDSLKCKLVALHSGNLIDGIKKSHGYQTYKISAILKPGFH